MKYKGITSARKNKNMKELNSICENSKGNQIETGGNLVFEGMKLYHNCWVK